MKYKIFSVIGFTERTNGKIKMSIIIFRRLTLIIDSESSKNLQQNKNKSICKLIFKKGAKTKLLVKGTKMYTLQRSLIKG